MTRIVFLDKGVTSCSMNVTQISNQTDCRVAIDLSRGDSERSAFRKWVDESTGVNRVTVEFSGSGFRDLDSWYDFLECCSRLASRKVSLFFEGNQSILSLLSSFGVRLTREFHP
jgi:hypothetical protein